MRVLIILLISVLFINVNAQKMKEYKIEIDINASKEKVWEVITDFENYPKWNSVLVVKNNDSLKLGHKFHVIITKPMGKKSKFKATVISKKEYQLFSVTHTIIGK